MKLPERMTQKWVNKRTDKELQELLEQLPSSCCRYHMVERQVRVREQICEGGQVA